MTQEQSSLQNALKAWALGEAVRCASCRGSPGWGSVASEIQKSVDWFLEPILTELELLYNAHTWDVKISASAREEWDRAMEREKHKKPADGAIF
jgi:hypothetical protein